MPKRLRKERANGKVKQRGQKKKNAERKYLHERQIRDPQFRKQYDHKKTYYQNVANTNLKKLYKDVLPKGKDIPKCVHKAKLNEDEYAITQQLVGKHDDDYQKMAHDIKINVFQWTVRQCEKKALLFKEGAKRTYEAELMSGLGMDLRKPILPKDNKRNVFRH